MGHTLAVFKVRPFGEAVAKATFKNDYVQLDALITHFDIDSNPAAFVVCKCSECGTKVAHETKVCTQEECDMYCRTVAIVSYEYDVAINISDETGSLNRIKVASACVEKALGVSAGEFLIASSAETTELKWKLLLERFKIVVHVRPNGKYGTNDAETPFFLRVVEINALSLDDI